MTEPAPFKRAFRLDRRSRSDARASVDDELAHHLDLVTEELVAAGWTEEEARRESVRQFGDLSETRAYCEEMQTQRGREERRTMTVDELWQDLKYALRSIRKAPGYAGLVILTIAFGIAANTTTFSVMNPFLFRALPYGDADALVQVNQVNPVTGWDMDRFSFPQYLDWLERTRAFEDVAAYVYGSATLTGDQGPEQVQYSRLSANMLEVLRSEPALGRGFRAEEAQPGAEPVVLLGNSLWERRYNADPGIVGRTLTLDGVAHTVIGVMPRDFNFPFGSARLWIPIQATATADRGRNAYQLIGRLNEGWTIDRAHAELVQIQTELATLYPETDAHMSGVTVKPIREALNFGWDILSILFTLLLGAVGFVLLIACVNVASLTLARGSTRQREIAVRASLGAGRGRIVRQLLTESLVLALVAGALGVGVSYWLAGLIDPVVPEDLYKIGRIRVDGTALAFSLFVTLLTPIAFALLPALRASRTDLTGALKEGSKGSGGLATSRGRRALVVAQVALAVVLISGAGLMMRSFGAVRALDLGFDETGVVTAEVLLPDAEYPTGEERRAFLTEVVEVASGLEGVEAASAVAWLPLNHETMGLQIGSADMLGTPGEGWPLVVRNRTYPGYFEAMDISMVAGRDFGSLDAVGAQEVVIVSRGVADRFWPAGDALGQTLFLGDPEAPHSASVVGVVEDIRHRDPTSADEQVYEPALQAAHDRFFVVARRADGNADEAIAPLRSALAAFAPELAPTVRAMEEFIAENQMQWSISSVFLGIFGAGALLLATLGIYGLISYSVAQRDREIGVRIAMGATRGEIRTSVVRDAVRLTGIGLVLGLAAVLALGPVASAALYEVGAADPVTLAGVMILFVGVSALASLVPAVRASSTSPIDVLRAE